jgi:hypothetical protein
MLHKLTLQEFWAVKRALAAGARHVEIARELNLSVWTIARIDDDRQFEAEEVSERDLPVDDAPPDYVATNLRRCGGCGAMIYVLPCIACQLATATQRVPPAVEMNDDEEQSRELTKKQRRWRNNKARRFVFGEVA